MNHFKTEGERRLWIKLNAERQIEWEKGLTWFNKETGKYEPTRQALHPRSLDEAMEISENQLEHDEKIGKLRFTLAQLFTLDINELNEIQQARHDAFIKQFME